MTPSILKTSEIRYSYPKSDARWILDGVSISVEQGEYVLLCGASGSGKSTLCRMLNGLIPHFYGGTLHGEIAVSGLTTANTSVGTLFEHVGIVFQNPEAQLFNRTVKREIVFGLESLGLPREDIEMRLSKIVETTHIQNLLARNPHDLSGGEQQLVSIAAILALQPKLIVLDEPYANLDPFNVDRVRDLLKKINQTGVGIIISEHRLRYAVNDVQRMIVLHQGRVILDGSPAQVLTQDVESVGLELPLAVSASRRLNLLKPHLDIKHLTSDASTRQKLHGLIPNAPKPLPPNTETVLKAKEIFYASENEFVLENINFSLKKGECLAIVGANGAGKTTLLKQLNGICCPSRGQIFIKGHDASQQTASQLAQHFGLALQNPNSQFFKLSVLDEIRVGPQVLGCYDEKWIETLIHLFQLGPLLDRSPYRLSGGEKKRVAFCIALASRPTILALDEPTAGQDGYFRRALGEFMIELRSMGLSILLITHDLTFAEQHSHRWLLMAKGRIVAEGSPKEVMADKPAMDHANLTPTDAFKLFESHIETR